MRETRHRQARRRSPRRGPRVVARHDGVSDPIDDPATVREPRGADPRQRERREAAAPIASSARLWPWLLIVADRAALVAGSRSASYLRQGARRRASSCGATAEARRALAVGQRARRVDRVSPASPARGVDGVLAGRRSIGARGVGAWLVGLPGRAARARDRSSLAVALARPETYPHRHARGRLDRHHDRVRHVEVDGGDRPAARPHGRRAARGPAVPAPHEARSRRARDLRPAGDAAVPAHARHEDARADRRATSRSATCPSSAPRSATASRWRSRAARSDGSAIRRRPTCPESSLLDEGLRGQEANKVVILLSDGDNNWVTRFDPDEAARTAREHEASRSTRVLVGREESRPVRRHVGQPGDAAQHRARSPAASSSARPTTSRSTAASRPCARKLDTTKRTRKRAHPRQAAVRAVRADRGGAARARAAAVAHAAAEVAVSFVHAS